LCLGYQPHKDVGEVAAQSRRTCAEFNRSGSFVLDSRFSRCRLFVLSSEMWCHAVRQ
jgi:hypothetical protein